MNIGRDARSFFLVGLVSAAFALQAMAADAPKTAASDAMKPLGGERYQIGKIIVDRRAGSFTLPARVHVVDKPLEYLLTTTSGMKEYETLLESDVSGTEFNLACILLGLERDPTQQPYYQFNAEPLKGPRVEIDIVRKDGGKPDRFPAAEALFDPEKSSEPVTWVYTGSQKHVEANQFGADITGTLIGFVHDPFSIIESSLGLGIGAYGSVNGNIARLPPVGSEVELVITVARGKKADGTP